MPLVKTGYQRGSKHRDARPPRRPLWISECRQSFAPRAEQENAQQSVAEDVAALADVEMPVLEAIPVHPEEKMQYGIKDAAGVVSGEIRSRFNGNDDQPQHGGDPGLENMVTVGGQASAAPAIPEFPTLLLLDRIIRSLAGDHDIVYVALAQAGAADAHEARFLQKFRNGGAATVPHARFQSAHHLVNDHGD